MAAFNDREWAFQVKYDGFGCLAFIHDGRCRLISKNGKAYQRYDRLAADLARLPVESAILDGELVSLGPDSKPRPRLPTDDGAVSWHPPGSQRRALRLPQSWICRWRSDPERFKSRSKRSNALR
jgi:ATP dependent DNA ligase-like protein